MSLNGIIAAPYKPVLAVPSTTPSVVMASPTPVTDGGKPSAAPTVMATPKSVVLGGNTVVKAL